MPHEGFLEQNKRLGELDALRAFISEQDALLNKLKSGDPRAAGIKNVIAAAKEELAELTQTNIESQEKCLTCKGVGRVIDFFLPALGMHVMRPCAFCGGVGARAT